ncbi:MAG: response regulator [Ignavibacteria bacterium]|jgi:CheY-like chemotaxis protein|nr:response regulator [Ignavibacteria bacterium]
MKISYRILITALAAVVIIFASSTLTFYSFTGKIVLGLAGLALSLVFVLLFLNKKNARAKAEYSGFISLINQNLSLREMSDAVLARIIKTAGFTAGRIYMTARSEPVLLSSYGILNETSLANGKIDLYERVIEKAEEAEYFFTENFPVIRSGLLELQIRYLLIMPVIYNGKVIAVLEMASVGSPSKWAKEYLNGIKDQLASGLSKAYDMHQLENLVRELKVRREEPEKILQAEEIIQTEKIIPAEEVIPVIEPDEKTILVIDPNAENRKIIGSYLSSKNYNIIQSESSEEGIKGLLQYKPFAVTLSVSSNDMSSWHALKSFKENSAIPVILYNTVEPLNFGYGLGVYDYSFHNLDAALITSFAERLHGVKSVICAGFEDLPAIKDLKDVKVTITKEQNESFKIIKKLQPQIVFINAFMQKGDSISLIDRLKTSYETKDIPVVLCLKPALNKEEMALLMGSIEKAAIKSKGHRIEILKVIRDRIRMEEGIPEEDTSSILIESEPENDTEKAAPDVNKLPLNKVLIVDDDTDTLSEVGEILKDSGCETVFAKSGLECLTTLQKLKPDLILLDIMMPQMDGFETIKRIKAERNLKDIPVFALTAHEMIDEKEILIRNGFDDFVSKPVNSGSLSFKIEKVLNNIAE